jgi:hypothetical protein
MRPNSREKNREDRKTEQRGSSSGAIPEKRRSWRPRPEQKQHMIKVWAYYIKAWGSQ